MTINVNLLSLCKLSTLSFALLRPSSNYSANLITQKILIFNLPFVGTIHHVFLYFPNSDEHLIAKSQNTNLYPIVFI